MEWDVRSLKDLGQRNVGLGAQTFCRALEVASEFGGHDGVNEGGVKRRLLCGVGVQGVRGVVGP